MWEDNRGWIFSLNMDYKLIFWPEIMALIMFFFLTNMQHFTSQDINGWTGVVWIFLWIIVMYLSAVWTLQFTAEDPLISNVMLHYSKSVPMKKQANLVFGWTISLSVLQYVDQNDFLFTWNTLCIFRLTVWMINNARRCKCTVTVTFCEHLHCSYHVELIIRSFLIEMTQLAWNDTKSLR